MVVSVALVRAEANTRAADVRRETANRVRGECLVTQRQWDSIDDLAQTIFAPTGSTPTSNAVLQILSHVGFTQSDIQALIQNSAAVNAAKLVAFEKQHGPRPVC